MVRYHCPFCSSKYQLHIENDKGKMICGHCGDDLIEVPILGPVKFFSIIIILAFLTPSFATLFLLLKPQNKHERREDYSLIISRPLNYEKNELT